MSTENPKSVPVYALQHPDSKIQLSFDGTVEDAAIISFVYNLTEARRPQPSIEPERTIYKNLRPWKKIAVPKYIVIAETTDNLRGSQIVSWDGKKSLQGEAPWGRPVVGTLRDAEGTLWQVDINTDGIAAAAQLEIERQKIAEKKAAKAAAVVEGPPVVVEPVAPVEIEEPVAVAGVAAEEATHADYVGDKFSVSDDGHFIGDDGFVVPMDFDEFYERFPKYVLNWVKKRLNRFQVDEDVEDWTQDLLIHMKFLPQGSKHRIPGANNRPTGCQDVIETFNPYQQYGASERRFRNYINFCLANKFNTVQSKRQKNPVCRPGNIAYGSTPEASEEHVHQGDEFIHANSSILTAAAERLEKQHDDRLFTNQFKRFVKKSDPSVFPAIEALEATGPLGEGASYMGVTEQEFARCRARLKQLAECFLNDANVPKQRKPYKKHAATSTGGSDVQG